MGNTHNVDYLKAVAEELCGIAFNIEHTDTLAYGNKGCENGKYKLVDDCGKTQERDIKQLTKIADLFDKFFTAFQSESFSRTVSENIAAES